jgi:hypothetical protein
MARRRQPQPARVDERVLVNRARQLATRLGLIRMSIGRSLLDDRLDMVGAISSPRDRLLALCDLHDAVEPVVRARGCDRLLTPWLVERWRADLNGGQDGR